MERDCLVCMDNTINTIIGPCGHGACQACASMLQHCPMCRQPIQSRTPFAAEMIVGAPSSSATPPPHPHQASSSSSSSSSCAIPDHHWVFSSPSTSAIADSGSSNETSPATIHSSSPSGVAVVSGGCVSAYALQLDGNNDSFLDLGVFNFGQRDFTISFFLRTTHTQRYFDIMGTRTEPSHGNFFCIRMAGTNGRIAVEFDEHGGERYLALESADEQWNNGEWHLVTVKREAGMCSLFMDGELRQRQNAAVIADLNNGRPLRLGRSLEYDGEPEFAPNASFDDIRIYYRALGNDEISQLWSQRRV